jgi:hypothetical protein
VFTDIAGVNTFSRTLSSSDHSPASPVDQSQASSNRHGCVVAAADEVDVRVALAYVKAGSSSPSTPVVNKYSFTSPGNDWSYPFPFTVVDTENSPLGVGVSRDGQTIVATAFKRTGFKQQVVVFGPDGPTPLVFKEIPVSFEPLRYVLSADGSKLLIMSMAYSMIIDTHSGAIVYQATSYEYPSAGVAISGDGATFAKSLLADKRIEVYRKQQGTYVLYGAYHPTNLGQCYRIGLSDDGNTLVAGYWDSIYPGQTATVVVLNLQGTLPQVVYQDGVTGSGDYWNLVQDLSISADGSAFAVALTGSQSGVVPQLVGYARNGGAWSKVLQAHLPGSALAVDVSADGSKVAVASMRGHMEAPQGGGDLSLYRITPQDLVLDGVPTPGAHVFARYTAAADVHSGAPVALLTAPQLSDTAHVLPGIGTLFLPRMQTHPVSYANVDGSGLASFDLTLPSGSVTIGTTAYYQALSLSPRRLSQTWAKLTIVP